MMVPQFLKTGLTTYRGTKRKLAAKLRLVFLFFFSLGVNIEYSYGVCCASMRGLLAGEFLLGFVLGLCLAFLLRELSSLERHIPVLLWIVTCI